MSEAFAPIEVTIFSNKRRVDVNWMYSSREFVSNYWEKILTLTVGSGSLAGLISWWIGKQRSKVPTESSSK